MAILEEVTEDEILPEETAIPAAPAAPPASIRDILAQLKPPPDVLSIGRTGSASVEEIEKYKRKSLLAVQRLHNLIFSEQRAEGLEGKAGSIQLVKEERRDVLLTLVKLDGEDQWMETAALRVMQEILSHPSLSYPSAFPSSTTLPPLPTHILSSLLPPLYRPHPSLSLTTSRALPRPAGGSKGGMDLWDEAEGGNGMDNNGSGGESGSGMGTGWKGYGGDGEGWGSWGLLRWCLSVMDESQIASQINFILPPLLTLLDDYEPMFRLRGMRCLEGFLNKVGKGLIVRMGIGNLFLQSIQHSISLHPSPPSPSLLPIALPLLLTHLLPKITSPTSSERAEIIAEAVEKGLINGWNYAPTGKAGEEGLRAVAEGVEVICQEVGMGVVRWLKVFIPSLISPCLLPPSSYALSLQLSNLQALSILLKTIEGTGRSARWRGEILNGIGRAYLGCEEKLEFGMGNEKEDQEERDDQRRVQTLCREVFGTLVRETPSIKDVEAEKFKKLSPRFQGLVNV